MGLLKGVGLLAGAAAAAAVMFARKRSAETGRDIAEVMADLPDELRKAAAEMKAQIRESISVGRKAAAKREAEIDRLIEAEDARLAEASREPEKKYEHDENDV
ncbi:MAG: hypothetical protein ACYC5A_03480 [Thermoleophilia bacterium]